MKWLKRAFAIDPPGLPEPTDAQREVVDGICRQIVKRRLTTPTLLFLEMSRPLNYVGSQAMTFFQPFVAAVTDAKGYEEFAKFLEHRGSVEFICRRIEETEAEWTAREKAHEPAERRSDQP